MARLALFALLFAGVTPVVASAQALTPELARGVLADPDSSSMIALGDCVLTSLRDGTKLELANTAVDASVVKCDRQVREYFSHMPGRQPTSEETAKVIAGFRAYPAMARGVVVSAAIHTYQLREAANAGGQPADSTARSK